MGDFDAQMKVTVGDTVLPGSTAQKYTYGATPKVDGGLGLTTIDVTLSVSGYVQGADETELASNMAAIEAACQQGGATISVYGLGGVRERSVLASLVIGGGPYAKPEFSTDGGGIHRRAMTLTVAATYGASGSWTEPPVRYTQTVAQAPDDARTITRKGWVGAKKDGATGDGGSAGGMTPSNVFKTYILAAFNKDYPSQALAAPGTTGWAVDYTYEEDADGRSGQYTLRAAPLADILPGATKDNTPIDGTFSSSDETDEAGRKTKSFQYDFLYSGDPKAIHAEIRRLALLAVPEGVLTRDDYQLSTGRQRRIRGMFTLISAAEADGIIEFTQDLDSEDENNYIAAKSYPGLGVVLYQEMPRARVAVQSGRAVGVGFIPIPPPGIFDAKYLSAPGKVKTQRLGGGLYAISWSYAYIFVTAPAITADVLSKIDIRPTRPKPPDDDGEGT